MIRTAALLASLATIAACSSEPIVLENTGRTIHLTGGPASISSTAEAMDYHQPTADRLCQENGHRRAESAGEQVDAFIASYLYRCTD